MPRGGYRPNSSFKKGNLAALKHGKYSKQIQGLLEDANKNEMIILDKKRGLRVFKLVKKGEK